MIDKVVDLTNIPVMSGFVQAVFREYSTYPGAPALPPPKISGYVDKDGTEDSRLVDAHWETPLFEMLLSLQDGQFFYYADDYKGREFKSGNADPAMVANVIYLLST